MSAPHGVVERRGLFGLSDREWGNVLVAAWGLALAAALWPAVAVALVAWAAAAATRRGWGWLAGSVAVAALPLAFGADAGALLEAAPAWKTSAALDRLGVGGWLEAVAPVCVPLGLALAAAARARQRWVGGAQGRLERRQRREVASRARAQARARARGGAPKRDRDRRALKLGLFLDGDRDAVRLRRRPGGGEWLTVSLDDLTRHMLVAGGSGSGKTMTLLRVCAELARLTDWRIFYVDAKSRSAAGRTFPALMRASGRACAVFPEQPYGGWRGDPAELANRLIRSVPFGSEEGAAYYADTARQIVQLACGAPAGPPGDSSGFLARLQRSALHNLYDGHPGQQAVGRLDDREVDGAYRRYSAFFGGAHGALDGGWAFEDADAAYLLVDTQRFGDAGPKAVNYLLEDFVQFVAGRRGGDRRRALIVVDEFSAAARSSPAAVEIVERLRELGGHGVLAPQVLEGLGDRDGAMARILGSTHIKVLHSVPDPDVIAKLAGTRVAIEASAQLEDDRATGMGSAREQHQMRISPQHVRELEQGEAFVIRSGRAARCQIAFTAPPAVSGAVLESRFAPCTPAAHLHADGNDGVNADHAVEPAEPSTHGEVFEL